MPGFGPLTSGSYALIVQPYRKLATLVPDAVIEELHYDGTQITDHPVEIGAAISDHAFLRPDAVELRYGWSNSSAQTVGYVQQVYQALLAIRAARQPFDISTGKRYYKNMMLGDLRIVTDRDSEYALMVTAFCRLVLIAHTQGGGGLNGGGNNSSQQYPQQTGGTSDSGTAGATTTTIGTPGGYTTLPSP